METLRLHKPDQPAMVTSWFTRSSNSIYIPMDIIYVITSFVSLWMCHCCSKEEIQKIIDVYNDPDGKRKFELELASTAVNEERIKFVIEIKKYCRHMHGIEDGSSYCLYPYVVVPNPIEYISGFFGFMMMSDSKSYDCGWHWHRSPGAADNLV